MAFTARLAHASMKPMETESEYPQSSSFRSGSEAEQSTDPTFVPTNVAVRIFSFVSRDDLDNCVLVCKQWKWLIEYGESFPLAKRPLDAVWLSTNHEFSMTAFYKQRVKTFVFKKYFKDRDITGAEIHKSYRMTRPYQSIHAAFPCGRPVPSTHIPIDILFDSFNHFHQKQCKQNSRPLIYNSRGSIYSSKLFTPPLAFYERLEWLLRRCEVRSLVLCKFTFTDLFVEKFREYMPQPFKVNQLLLHCCKLRFVTTYSFHAFVGEMVIAKQYFMENLRFCLPNHVNGNLLRKEGIHRAQVLFIGRCLSRYNTNLNFNFDDETFLNFIKSSLATIPEKDITESKNKMFLGVAQSRVTQEAINQYNKIYLHASPKQKVLLYDHLLFDSKRFLSEELEELARNGELIDPGAQDDNPLPPAQPLPHPPIAQANPLSYF